MTMRGQEKWDEKPVVVALHGWGARGQFFDDLAQRLGWVADLIALDLAGHGTERGADDLSLAAMASQVHKTLQSLDGRPCFLLGWSMGAGVAFEYLKIYGSDGLSGLIIEDMSPKPVNGPDWNLGLRNSYCEEDVLRTVGHIRQGWQDYGPRVWRATFADLSTARRFENDPLFALFLDNETDPMARAWQSIMSLDARDMLASVELPILCLMGTKSHVYGPDLAEWYRKKLKNGQVEMIEGAGHAPHLEKAQSFAEQVSAFIQRHA